MPTRRQFLTLAGAALSAGARPHLVLAQDTESKVVRLKDVIYRKKEGVALTMDVLKPEKPSGVGVLWMVSGGWFSNHDNINVGGMKAFLDRGQTVFCVVHGSQPRFGIADIVPDIDRAVRFVRYHAKDYGVDPDRLAISGGSAGGHLSLMQGCLGKETAQMPKDDIDRTSSRVQAVACFYPPTDFLNWGQPGQNALMVENLKPFYVAFQAKSREPEELTRVSRFCSPMTYVTKQMPPTLIIHGDKDTLVPIQQAQIFDQKLGELGVTHKLIVKEGAGHGWATIGEEMKVLAEWIDRHTAKKP